jgi:hypothetical protein
MPEVGQLHEQDLSDEDAKLLTLAKGSRARIGASSGAAVRDETGRTYASAAVSLSSLRLSALQAAVAQAVAAGARGLEAAVAVTEEGEESLDLSSVADLGGTGVVVIVVSLDGGGQVSSMRQVRT